MGRQNTIADAMSTLKNASDGGKSTCTVEPASKLIGAMLRIMQDAGYIGSFEYIDDRRGGQFQVHLSGGINKCGVITPRYSVGLEELEVLGDPVPAREELRPPDPDDLAGRAHARAGPAGRDRGRAPGVRLLRWLKMAFEATAEIPDGVTVSMDGTRVVVTGPKGTLTRDMRFPGDHDRDR